LGKKTVSAIIKKIESMPTLPTVAFRVMEITDDSRSSANDLMKIISPDVSLTAKILKIANSPFYGLTREISSLQHAFSSSVRGSPIACTRSSCCWAVTTLVQRCTDTRTHCLEMTLFRRSTSLTTPSTPSRFLAFDLITVKYENAIIGAK